MSLPPSSPRLPSPPPPTEIQIGPKSPSLGDSSGVQETSMEQGMLDANAARRIHPGTKSAEMAAGPPLVPLMELDSAFQLQEHLKALHYHYTKPSSGLHTIPISRSTAALVATPPNGVDRALWLYELCRFLINKCNDIIIGFLFDSPPCSSTTCPEMRASEWQFLCAVHESPKSCCAIDYCCHTLDWATNIVTSQKIFPSRLSLGSGDSIDERGTGVKHLVNIFRRLHRIFAHAWFQHREVFWRVEGQTGLYVLFKMVCDNYELLPAENYKLPPEAEGLEPVPDNKPLHTILKPEFPPATNVENKQDEEDPNFMGVGRTSTRRHIRSSPSTGSAVTTVLEADEDDTDMTQKLADAHIADDEGRKKSDDTEPVKQESVSERERESEPLPKRDDVEVQVDAPLEAQVDALPQAQVDYLPEVQVDDLPQVKVDALAQGKVDAPAQDEVDAPAQDEVNAPAQDEVDAPAQGEVDTPLRPHVKVSPDEQATSEGEPTLSKAQDTLEEAVTPTSIVPEYQLEPLEQLAKDGESTPPQEDATVTSIPVNVEDIIHKSDQATEEPNQPIAPSET